MAAPFKNVLTAVKWYRHVAAYGLGSFVTAFELREKVVQSPSFRLDERIGEPALIWKRLDGIIEGLDNGERELLLGNDPAALGLRGRKAMWRRQYKLRKRLAPVFVDAELVEE